MPWIVFAPANQGAAQRGKYPAMTHQPNTYLAFDLGASSVRAILGTLEGNRLRLENTYRFQTPIIEAGEPLYWDLDALWRGVNTGLERAIQSAPQLRSLAVDSWGVDYVPLGDNRKPIRNAYCYRDPRTLGMMDKVCNMPVMSSLNY